MKIVGTLALLFLLGPFNQAKPQFTEWSLVDWRDTSQELIQSRSNLEGHLLSGVWKLEAQPDQGLPQVMQFSPNGRASQLVQRSDGRYDHLLLNWQLLEHEEQAILYMQSPAQGEQRYLIDASSGQIKLVGMGGFQTVWTAEDEMTSQTDLSQKARQLSGSWENVSHGMDIQLAGGEVVHLDHAIIRYELHSSGEYVRAVYRPGSEKAVCREAGRWELSKDGDLIFFHPRNGGRVSCAEIEWLAMDELVLEQNAPFAGPSTARLVDLYFNKH